MPISYNYQIDDTEVDRQLIREEFKKRLLNGKLEEDYTRVRLLLSYIHTDLYKLLYPNRSKSDTQKVIRKLTIIFQEILMVRESALGSRRVLIE